VRLVITGVTMGLLCNIQPQRMHHTMHLTAVKTLFPNDKHRTGFLNFFQPVSIPSRRWTVSHTAVSNERGSNNQLKAYPGRDLNLGRPNKTVTFGPTYKQTRISLPAGVARSTSGQLTYRYCRQTYTTVRR
jgi:hypothetical protein